MQERLDQATEIIGPDENGTASQNYAQGELLRSGGKAYKATTAIASGESIVPGTNATEPALIAEINEANTAISNAESVLAQTMREQTAINANTDLNDVTETGFYLLYSGKTYTNAPSFYSSGSAWLFVYDVTSSGAHFRIQVFMKTTGKIYAIRSYWTSGTGAWGAWTEYTTDDTLTQTGKAADAKVVGDALAKTMREQTAINVNTDLQVVFAKATREYIEAGLDQQGKGYDPRKLLKPGREAIVVRAKELLSDFGSVGKGWA